MGFVTELMWHHIFGEPWLMPRQNFTLIFPYPDLNPHYTSWPSASHSATHTRSPAPTESQPPFKPPAVLNE